VGRISEIRQRRVSRQSSVVLALALSVAASALAACSSGAQSQPSVHYPVASLGPIAVSVGETITSGGLEVTVLDAECSSEGPQGAGHVWAGFKLAVRNSNPVQFVWPIPNPISAYSDDGKADLGTYYWPVGTNLPPAWHPLWGNPDIRPATTETGWVVFDVASPQRDISFFVYAWKWTLLC
jgi:hypothetical protein